MKREDCLDQYLSNVGLPSVIQLPFYNGPPVTFTYGVLLACSHNRSSEECRELILKLLHVANTPSQLFLGSHSRLKTLLGRMRKNELKMTRTKEKNFIGFYSQEVKTELLDINLQNTAPPSVPPVPRRPYRSYRSSSVPISSNSSEIPRVQCPLPAVDHPLLPSVLSRRPSLVESVPAPSRTNTAESSRSLNFVLPPFPRFLLLEHQRDQLQQVIKGKNMRISVLQSRNKNLSQALKRRNIARDRAPKKRNRNANPKKIDIREFKDCKKNVAQLKVQLTKLEEKHRKVKLERDRMRERADVAEDKLCKLEETDGKLVIWDKHGNKYSDHLFEHIMRFSQLGIADKKLPAALVCAASLAGLQLDRVPSVTTCRRASLMETGLSRIQLEEVLNSPLEAPLTHYSDETTKGGTKIQVHGFSRAHYDGHTIPDRQIFIIGLAPVENKSAQTSFDCLRDLVAQCTTDSCAELFDKYATNVKNIMGDRASTQLKFASVFETYRESVMLKNGDFVGVSPSERLELTQVNGLFCQVHVTANIGTLSENVCLELDGIVIGDQLSGRACVFELLEEVGRFFGPRGSNKYPYYKRWMEWMRSKGKVKTLEISPSIPSFIHHRFNISFVIATRVLYWRAYLLEFIQLVYPDDKHLVEVSRSLESDYILSQLQVLGLVDQLITGPLWRLSLDSTVASTTLGGVPSVISWIREVVESPEKFFCDDSRHTTFHGDDFLDALLAITPGEWGIRLVAELMEQVLGFLEAVYKDYLPGGEVFRRQEEFEKETASSLCHNIPMESAFGHMDHLFRRMPLMDFTRRAGKVVFARNGTLKWLEEKNSEERHQIVARVRKNLPAFQKEMHSRRDALQKLFLKSAMDLQKRVKERKCIDASKSKKAAEALGVDGFWETKGEVDDKLFSLSPAAQTSALCAQIRFRQYCLQQEVSDDPKFFRLSKDGVPHDYVALRRKLLVLIDQGITSNEYKEGRWLENWRITHFFEVNGERKSFDGEVYKVFETTTGDAWVQLIYDKTPQNVHTFPYEEIAQEFEDGDFLLTQLIRH